MATESEMGFDLLAPAGARASKEGVRMTSRRFGLGDIVTIIGIVFYVAFMLVYVGTYIADSKKIDFVAFGQIILILLVGMPIAALVLSFRNERFLNLQYAFTGLIVLLKLSQVSVIVPKGSSTEGLDFYVILGALAVGVGTYLSQVGIGELKPGGADETSSPVGVEDRLRELSRLKESGLITAEEFTKKREEILNDLP